MQLYLPSFFPIVVSTQSNHSRHAENTEESKSLLHGDVETSLEAEDEGLEGKETSPPAPLSNGRHVEEGAANDIELQELKTGTGIAEEGIEPIV